MPAEGDPTSLITEAIHNHFTDKAESVLHDLNDLFLAGPHQPANWIDLCRAMSKSSGVDRRFMVLA